MRRFSLCLALAVFPLPGSAPRPLIAQWQAQVAVESRLFAGGGLQPEESKAELGLVLWSRAQIEWDERAQRLVVEPFLRVGLLTGERVRFDLRELSWIGRWKSWELRVGMAELFWGVAESRPVIDVINQRYAVGSVRGYEKLGQPLLRLLMIRNWGTLQAILLPRFRERPFEGGAGRLWSPLPVVDDEPVYESPAEADHVDWAVRWSHTLGSVDVGVAHFAGTTRDPRFELDVDRTEATILVPHYDLMAQTSLDVQWTSGSWLWKLEALTRSSVGERHWEAAGGLEYAPAEYLSVFLEYLFDTRGERSTTSYEHDLFLGGQLLLPEGRVQAGVYLDTDSGNTILKAGAARRLNDFLTLDLQGRVFLGAASREPAHATRQDSFLALVLTFRY